MYCDYGVLLRLAKEVGQAYKNGNMSAMAEAEERLREYEALIYESEGMIIPNVDLNGHKEERT
jgi:hypothetical protein